LSRLILPKNSGFRIIKFSIFRAQMSSHSKSYKQDKIQGTYDAIVIGSGLGGMSTAAFLAKEGKKVLVLERHYTPGGFTHVFKRPGYEWDVGVHYVGEVHRPHTEVSKMFNYITDGTLKWEEMDEVYDKMFFGNSVYDFPRGADAFRKKMKSYFPAPEDQKAIDEYVDLIYSSQRTHKLYFGEKVLPSFLGKLVGGFMRKKGLEGNKTTLEVLSKLTKNKKLIAVLTGQFGDYGLPPSTSSFMMHSMLVKHFMNGGNYPIGGSGQIFEKIAPVVQKAGGEIFTYADVKEIIVKNNKAVGVRMVDGKELFAPVIISDAGIYNTYQQLLPKVEQVRLKTDDFFKHLQPSVGHICLYIGINKSNSELKLGKANYWIFPDNYDHDLNVANYVSDPEAAIPVVYVSFPSSKDPDWDNRFPGKTTIEIITLAPYEWYKQWEDKRWKKRGEDYNEMKEKLSQRLLEALYAKHPDLRGKIDFYELSTPLSTQHFANYQYGELYGIDHTTTRYEQRFLRPQSPLKNLYLTGQDVISCGIGGALVSGMLTAISISKKNLVKKIG
ncbi:MAG: Phytoene dehydrogenase, partial [Bacteroidota bacterium]|nr:Phytoene dehydrogenase [Bacteroidota bacterium]